MAYEDVNVTLIGATKGLGVWIAEQLIKNKFNVKITSRNKLSGKKVADEIGALYSNDNVKAIEDADIVIFCVPIDFMNDTIKEVAPHAKENTLLMDITSVKIDPSEALLKYAPKNCEILPTHPMFGPRISSFDGQVVILTPIENRCCYWYDKVKNFLNENNTDIVISTPEEHDKTMSVVQGLTHFSYISIASTIKRLNVSVKKSREFASPVYSLMLDMISRIVSQNPYLYYSIQKSNSITTETRKTLIEESIKLSEFVEKGCEKEFVDNMRESAKHLDEFEEALGRSDKAISILTNDLNYLKDSIGKEVGLKHQYSGNIHVGIIKHVDTKNVYIDEKNKEVSLKISNVTILTDSELYEWKKKNCKLYSFDISLLLPATVNKDIILDVLNKIDEIVTVKIIDEYHGIESDEKISLTFSYTTFNKDDHISVEKYIAGMGIIIR